MIKFIKYLLETIRVYTVEHKDVNKLKETTIATRL